MALRTMVLELDEDDYDTIQDEFARLQKFRDKHGVLLPDGESNLPGAMIAESHYWTCPSCGSHYFGTPCKIVNGKSELDFSKVRCHGESSGGPFWCGQMFPWPGYKQEEQNK